MAHKSKINSGQFNSNDTLILSAGRDNAVRLWDTRMIIDPSYKGNNSADVVSTPLREFNKHKCVGYNIAVNFLNYENYLITGSEDNQVYLKFIYN